MKTDQQAEGSGCATYATNFGLPTGLVNNSGRRTRGRSRERIASPQLLTVFGRLANCSRPSSGRFAGFDQQANLRR
jgi:hypothetical protein